MFIGDIMKNSKKIEKINNNTRKNLNIKEKYNKFKETMQLKSDISRLKDEWAEVMAETRTYNNMKLALTLRHIKKEDYGWSSRIYSPYGIPLEKLETLTQTIESGLKCKFFYDIPEHKTFAMCKIIYPSLVKCNEIPFIPQKVKPYELYIGINIAGESVIENVNNTPHVLLAGQTRKGKNGSLDHILTSLIWSCDETKISLYLFQCAKNDLIKYKNCKQVKCFVLADFIEMEKQLENLLLVIDERIKMMESMVLELKGDNLFDYNKLNPKKQLPYIYVVIDEFMVLMLPNKDKAIANIKTNILGMLEKIGEMGGSCGINYIICHQKPEKALMPTFIKNMSLIRICFGFDDETCGRIVLGEKYGDLAFKLPARRAYYSADGKIDLIFTTNLRELDNSSRIKQFIQSSIKNNTIKNVHDRNNKSASILDSKSKITYNTNNHTTVIKPIDAGVLNTHPNNSGIIVFKPKNKIKQLSHTKKNPNNIQNNNSSHIDINTTFDRVDANTIKKEIDKQKANITKIPNFVPYIPIEKQKGIVIIDETNITKLPTQKPIKKKEDD